MTEKPPKKTPVHCYDGFTVKWTGPAKYDGSGKMISFNQVDWRKA